MDANIQSQLAAQVAAIVAHANATQSTKLADLDPAAKPLLQLLVQAGEIPNDQDCHVEWQGVWEFGIVPVFYGDAMECLNVNADGSVDQF